MVAFTITAQASNGFGISWAPGAGETTFEIELNRERDFSSDISLLLPSYTSSDNTILGLPSNTPFWIRVRKTNGGNGPWTAPVLRSTTNLNPAPYAGFSMDKSGLVVPAELLMLSGSSSTPVAGHPLTNLTRDDPQSIYKVFRAPDLLPFAGMYFETSGEPIDTVALLGTMANDEAVWTIRCGDSLADVMSGAGSAVAVVPNPTTFRCSPTIGRRSSYHGIATFAPQTKRFWGVFVQTNGRLFIARHLVAGRMRSSVNASRGFGSAPNDFGGVSRNRFGTPDRLAGWRGRVLDFECSWLSEAEYQTKWSDLDTLIGLSRPALIIQNLKRNAWMQDRIGFGELSQMRGEIMRGDRWSKRIECKSLY